MSYCYGCPSSCKDPWICGCRSLRCTLSTFWMFHKLRMKTGNYIKISELQTLQTPASALSNSSACAGAGLCATQHCWKDVELWSAGRHFSF
jgi:hypothetical protein